MFEGADRPVGRRQRQMQERQTFLTLFKRQVCVDTRREFSKVSCKEKGSEERCPSDQTQRRLSRAEASGNVSRDFKRYEVVWQGREQVKSTLIEDRWYVVGSHLGDKVVASMWLWNDVRNCLKGNLRLVCFAVKSTT